MGSVESDTGGGRAGLGAGDTCREVAPAGTGAAGSVGSPLQELCRDGWVVGRVNGV